MPGRLQDRIALITGASSGIGRATAILYASEGAKLVCADLNEGTWREVAPSDESNGPTHERIQQNGGEAIFVKTDVSDPNSVEAAVAAAVEKFGRLDIMINNAGFAMESRTPGPIWELSTDLFHKTASVNINGVFYGVKYAAAQMVKQEPLSNGSRGCILNAASVLGLVGSEGAAAYCTSKGAVANMTRAAALDCAPQKIRVCAVNPGYIETHMTDKVLENDEARQFVDSMHPLGGVGKPMDIARAYLFLASDEASWITGVNMPVDGGYTAR